MEWGYFVPWGSLGAPGWSPTQAGLSELALWLMSLLSWPLAILTCARGLWGPLGDSFLPVRPGPWDLNRPYPPEQQ